MAKASPGLKGQILAHANGVGKRVISCFILFQPDFEKPGTRLNLARRAHRRLAPQSEARPRPSRETARQPRAATVCRYTFPVPAGTRLLATPRVPASGALRKNAPKNSVEAPGALNQKLAINRQRHGSRRSLTSR